MVRDGVFDAEFAEPAIGEVQLHLTTDQPFRADRKHIAHDQHPDHQLRIDRRATHRRIMRCKFTAKPGKIERGIDLAHQMIFRDRLVEMKLVEQLTLVTLQTAHHGSTSPRFASTQRNHRSRPISTDFCNKICHKQTHALQQKTSLFDQPIWSGMLYGSKRADEFGSLHSITIAYEHVWLTCTKRIRMPQGSLHF